MLDRLVKVFVHRVGERLFLIMKTTTTKTINLTLKKEWKTAAAKEGKDVTAWIQSLADDHAFLINCANQIERIKDLRAHEKAATGEEISFEEFERSKRHAATLTNSNQITA